jgi:crotonobetainyl-CoA hydratase
MSTTETAPAAVLQRHEHVLVITRNRPDARNAVNSAVSTAVGEALAAAQATNRFAREPISRRRPVARTGAHPGHPEWGFAGYVHHFIDKPTIGAEEANWAQLSREAVAMKKAKDAAKGLEAFVQRRQPV